MMRAVADGYRYIQLQEEYIKDEQRYGSADLFGIMIDANIKQKLEERACTSARGD
jgi:hypothetical protein